ncbi:hypothetical protein conserved [Entamoeba histolytica]|uniref:AIG1-type G domain-containing protein n=2 Tax=Entamoeba histolytica TaxID=5759 RepID=A0A175K128_ENTHI|nr:hypothetical protein conserved [Entamoeba histolytica]
MSRVIVRFLLNGQCIATKPLNSQDSLKTVREKLKEKMSDSQHFLTKDGDKINANDEEDFIVEDIINNEEINLKEEKENTPEVEPNVPIEGSIRLKDHENGKLKIYLYPNQEFNQKDENDAIAILVVGETGSGKTTLLNSFVNALYGIKITDDFRYIIINEGDLKQHKDQSKSQTSQVIIYNIKRTKSTPPIKIIDTPGFGDTRGPEWDKKITEQIKEAFETKVLDLNAICFVASSSNVRLTASQKYVFGNIINLFGNDVKKHFIAMLTFCDGKKPKVINALQSKECIFSTIIPEITPPWYLKFNNSAIYDDNTEDEFTQMFWKLGMKNFDDFITKLVTLPRISLEKSREVLKKREQIKAQLDAIKTSLNIGFSKMNEIEQTRKQFYDNREKVKKNQDFTVITTETVPKMVDLKKGEVVIKCYQCNNICHDPCHCRHVFEDGEEKVACYVNQTKDGNCVVCGCYYTHHKYSTYRIVYETVKKQQTAQDILDRYNAGKRGMANAEAMLKRLEEEYDKIQMECYDKEIEIVECVNKLSEIALNGKVTSSSEYLDMLIQTENDEKKPGYDVRVKGYKQLKQANEMIEDIMKYLTGKKSKEEIKAEIKRRMEKEIQY